jgi:hypothetical protein
LDALSEPQKVPAVAREHLGENPVVRDVILNGSGFTMVVRDPKKPENLDTYTYRAGKWDSRPVQVSLSDINRLDDDTFTLGKVNWSVIPNLMQQAYDGLDLENEEISSVSIDRLSGQNKVRIYISVNGDRGSGRLIAEGDGTNVDIARN